MEFFADFYRVFGIPILWLARFTKDVLYRLSHNSVWRGGIDFRGGRRAVCRHPVNALPLYTKAREKSNVFGAFCENYLDGAKKTQVQAASGRPGGEPLRRPARDGAYGKRKI